MGGRLTGSWEKSWCAWTEQATRMASYCRMLVEAGSGGLGPVRGGRRPTRYCGGLAVEAGGEAAADHRVVKPSRWRGADGAGPRRIRGRQHCRAHVQVGSQQRAGARGSRNGECAQSGAAARVAVGRRRRLQLVAAQRAAAVC